jgi:hypothetical protein
MTSRRTTPLTEDLTQNQILEAATIDKQIKEYQYKMVRFNHFLSKMVRFNHFLSLALPKDGTPALPEEYLLSVFGSEWAEFIPKEGLCHLQKQYLNNTEKRKQATEVNK